jgi:serine/threonine-protein kinase
VDLLQRTRTALHGRYDIESELGRGGMATVFRARDVRHDRTVAVKVLHPDLGEAVGAERFLREVRLTAKLSHPHILPLLDSGAADDLLYYVMPFVEGASLRERLRRDGPLPVDEALRITREVADALGRAHAMGIVHRDVKPENILLQDNHAMVADFGIARVFDGTTTQSLTMTGMAIGTPVYMSPEQASGESAVDGRSDIYSLACVTFEMLTGEPPYVGPTPLAITSRKLTEPVPPLRMRRASVSARVESTITRALARNPADRFTSALEFSAGLETSAAEVGGPPSRWRGRGVAIVAGVVVVGFLAWLGLSRPNASASSRLASIAVLPFDNLTPDSGQAYFAEGLADELVTSLSKVQGVRVASRTSTLVLARNGVKLADIGSTLGVESVLEGSLRMSAGRVRVSTRLVKVADGYPIWSESYERPAADMLKIQEDIAGAIVTALTGELGTGQRAAVQSGTTDPEAYDLYLQGRALRLRQTERALNSAVEFYRAALARAPDFVRAHAGLAEVFAVQGWYEYQPPREVFPLAAKSAAEALRLDPRNAAAHATSAYVALYYDWDLPRAKDEFERALALDPNSAIAHQWYANYLTVTRQWDRAEEAFATALLLDPAAVVRQATAIFVQHYRGDNERAVATYRRVVSIDSTYAVTFQWGAMALEQVGSIDEAVAALKVAVALSNRGASVLASLARAHAIRGDGAEARRLLKEVMSARVVPAYDVAKIHLALGDRNEAMRWLERAYENRSHSMLYLGIDPELRPLRSDAAFEALAKKVGI